MGDTKKSERQRSPPAVPTGQHQIHPTFLTPTAGQHLHSGHLHLLPPESPANGSPYCQPSTLLFRSKGMLLKCKLNLITLLLRNCQGFQVTGFSKSGITWGLLTSTASPPVCLPVLELFVSISGNHGQFSQEPPFSLSLELCTRFLRFLGFLSCLEDLCSLRSSSNSPRVTCVTFCALS